jgi:hypothetical protein
MSRLPSPMRYLGVAVLGVAVLGTAVGERVGVDRLLQSDSTVLVNAPSKLETLVTPHACKRSCRS